MRIMCEGEESEDRRQNSEYYDRGYALFEMDRIDRMGIHGGLISVGRFGKGKEVTTDATDSVFVSQKAGVGGESLARVQTEFYIKGTKGTKGRKYGADFFERIKKYGSQFGAPLLALSQNR